MNYLIMKKVKFIIGRSIMKKTMLSLFILISAIFLLPSHSEAAQLNFYDIVTLNAQEQAKIIKEKPTVSDEYGQYNLIYEKNVDTTNVSSNATGTSNKTNDQGTTTKTTKQANLPKAGENRQFQLVLFGTGFILISFFILYKHRKYSKLLLIVIIPMAFGPSPMKALAAEASLIPSEKLELFEGEAKMIEPKAIEGYTYVGYYPSEKVVLPAGESKITVLYVDENSQEIHSPQVLFGKIGESYDVSTEQYKLAIPGYVLNQMKLPPNAVGTIKEQEQTVVYEYQKELAQKGRVTVHYLDMNGQEIQPKEHLSGEIGQTFQIETKEISGFLFDHAVGDLEGTFGETEKDIQLYYTDEVTVNIHYIDKWTKQPLTLNSITPYADYLRPDISDIDGYYYTNSYNGKTYAQGETASEDQLTVKVGASYTLPKEIRFLITKPTGETMNTLNFPKPIEDLGWAVAIDSYSNFLYFQEKPEYIPANYTGIADQATIDVTYEVTFIPTVIPAP